MDDDEQMQAPEKQPSPYIGVERLAQVIDNISKIRRAARSTLIKNKTLTENQTAVITSELHSVVDDIKMAARYFEGTQNH